MAKKICRNCVRVISVCITCPRVNPEVLVLMPPSLAHFSGVTCLATREWVDLMLGKGGAWAAWKRESESTVRARKRETRPTRVGRTARAR